MKIPWAEILGWIESVSWNTPFPAGTEIKYIVRPPVNVSVPRPFEFAVYDPPNVTFVVGVPAMFSSNVPAEIRLFPSGCEASCRCGRCCSTRSRAGEQERVTAIEGACAERYVRRLLQDRRTSNGLRRVQLDEFCRASRNDVNGERQGWKCRVVRGERNGTPTVRIHGISGRVNGRSERSGRVSRDLKRVGRARSPAIVDVE